VIRFLKVHYPYCQDAVEYSLNWQRNAVFLDSLSERGIDPSIRGVTTLFGNSMEAQFPVNVALASLAVSRGAFFDPFDNTGVEQEFSGKPERILISTWGHWRGEALGLVDTPDVPLRGDDKQ
jgi:hypothetical protein